MCGLRGWGRRCCDCGVGERCCSLLRAAAACKDCGGSSGASALTWANVSPVLQSTVVVGFESECSGRPWLTVGLDIFRQ